MSDSTPPVHPLSDELERLHSLHTRGAISDDEFASLKAQLIAKGAVPSSRDAPGNGNSSVLETGTPAGNQNEASTPVHSESGAPPASKPSRFGCLWIIGLAFLLGSLVQALGPFPTLDAGDVCREVSNIAGSPAESDPMFVCKKGLRCVYSPNKGWSSGGMTKVYVCR